MALQEIDENSRWNGSFDHLAFLSEHTGVEIGCISTSPEREETILISGSKLEKLLLAR